MSNRLFVLLITAAALTFSSCQKAPNREAGNDGQGAGEPDGKVTATRSSTKCEVKYVLSWTNPSLDNPQAKVLNREETIRTEEGEKTLTKLSEKSSKSELNITEKVIVNKIKEDSSREQLSVKNYKTTQTRNSEETKLENNIYLQKAQSKTVREALDEASMFPGPNGEKLKTQTTEKKIEIKFFDDGKNQREIECKKDDKVVACDGGEYEITSTTNQATGAATVTEKLKAPWTDENGITTESYERKCTNVKKQ